MNVAARLEGLAEAGGICISDSQGSLVNNTIARNEEGAGEGIYLDGTAEATILNNVIERDADARMERTRRRPTASGRLRPGRAFAVGFAAVAAGTVALWAVAGGPAAVFALLGCGAFGLLLATI